MRDYRKIKRLQTAEKENLIPKPGAERTREYKHRNNYYKRMPLHQ
jgi:hypothetical protein